MSTSPIPRIAAAILLAAATRALADTVPGADWHLANAATVLLVHTPSAAEAEMLPPDLRGMLLVDGVLKGSDTRRYIPAIGPAQPPGARALALLRFPGMPYSPIMAEPKPLERPTEDALWPLTGPPDAPIVDTQITARMDFAGERYIPLDKLPALIAPEELSLHTQMLDALFFPTRHADLQKRDPTRAAFIQLSLALRDLARDIPALAGLLESPDPALRAAVAAHLQKLTRASLPIPATDTPAALHQHTLAWRDWWKTSAPALTWQETSLSFVPRAKDDDPLARRWPPLPASLELPPDALTESLLKTLPPAAPLEPAALAAAFRAFLDAGVARDRILFAASQVQWRYPDDVELPPRPAWCKTLLAQSALVPLLSFPADPRDTPDGILIHASFPSGLSGSSGSYLSPAPRLRPDLLFNPDIPAPQRLRLIACYAGFLHAGRFLAERQAALKPVNAPAPTQDHDLLRRAAFWEPYADYPPVTTIAEAAFTRLEASADPADQQFLRQLLDLRPHDKLALSAATNLLQKSGTPADQKRLAAAFLADPKGCGAGPWYAAVARQQDFINAILADLATSSGERFDWPGRILAEAKVDAVNPVLAARLNDPDPVVRQSAASNLSWNSTADIAPALLAAFAQEPDAKVHRELLLALTQTSDPRALDILLSAAQDPSLDRDVLTNLAIAFRRFNDPKALPVLAHFAATYRDDKNHLQTFNESIIAFGAISGLYAVPLPIPGLGRSHNINPTLNNAALPLIDQWLKDHPDPKPQP